LGNLEWAEPKARIALQRLKRGEVMDARQGIGKEIEEQIIPVELEIIGEQDTRLKRREAWGNTYSNFMEEPIAEWSSKPNPPVETSLWCTLSLLPLVILLFYCSGQWLGQMWRSPKKADRQQARLNSPFEGQ
jgi:hypothetical protein